MRPRMLAGAGLGVLEITRQGEHLGGLRRLRSLVASPQTTKQHLESDFKLHSQTQLSNSKLATEPLAQVLLFRLWPAHGERAVASADQKVLQLDLLGQAGGEVDLWSFALMPQPEAKILEPHGCPFARSEGSVLCRGQSMANTTRRPAPAPGHFRAVPHSEVAARAMRRTRPHCSV